MKNFQVRTSGSREDIQNSKLMSHHWYLFATLRIDISGSYKKKMNTEHMKLLYLWPDTGSDTWSEFFKLSSISKSVLNIYSQSTTVLRALRGLEKDRATHSNVLALRIPGTGEPGGLPSIF